MKKILLLLIPVLLLTGCSYEITKKENDQNLQTQTNNSKQVTSSLELQAKCADMAKKYFTDKGYKGSDGFDYTNHYNQRLSKCFILISSYTANDDFLTYDLYDALEGKHYAMYIGHNNCNLTALSATGDNLKKCQLDSGSIWFDGNDTKNPADFHVGFQGIAVGPGTGDENTQKQFMDRVQQFIND